MTMKVLLVEPPFSPFDVPQGIAGMPEPLALETVASKICDHHDVTILDMRIETDLDKYLEEIVLATGMTIDLFVYAQEKVEKMN